uniref:Uncharacterized protein n=1 Tax=virus sp. ctLl75 TaxID=2828249 RepID=A0A8S5RB75_9VIRU|nr:MAG TPA: hypothetical protein [virus sp. ctLl75]
MIYGGRVREGDRKLSKICYCNRTRCKNCYCG